MGKPLGADYMKNEMRRVFVVGGLVLLACFSMIWATEPPKPGKTVFVLFDLSGSAVSERSGFEKDFERILGAIQPGDVLIADKISDNPLAESEFPINIEFPAFKASTDNPLVAGGLERKHQANFVKRKTEISKQVHQYLESASSKWTDIFGGLGLAERVFKTYKKGDRVLVIMSDMIQDSTDYNFENKNFTPSEIASIIKAKRAKTGISDLTGVSVYVTGAVGANTAQFSGLRSFWKEYFQQAGANFKEENYGRTLLKFID
jgi:hypothetical protein